MADCCNDKACEIDALHKHQSSRLKIVLAINAVMSVIELTEGLIGHSALLVADSLDMLGDSYYLRLVRYRKMYEGFMCQRNPELQWSTKTAHQLHVDRLLLGSASVSNG
jgi:hypothetical protein